MKNKLSIALSFFLVAASFNLMGQGDPEPYLKDVIKAYQNKDLSLLEKHAAPILQFALNDDFFESSDAKPLVAMAEDWNGAIIEIRYDLVSIMGTEALVALAYFGDNPSGNYNVAMVSSIKGSEWKAFGLGLSDVSEDEFNEASTDIPVAEPEEVEAEVEVEPSDKRYSGFSVEMADGEAYENPSVNKLKASLERVDTDNFFLILNSPKGFLQTTISEQGYIVQYNEGDGLFEAESYLSLEEVINVFSLYLKDGEWKDIDSWIRM